MTRLLRGPYPTDPEALRMRLQATQEQAATAIKAALSTAIKPRGPDHQAQAAEDLGLLDECSPVTSFFESLPAS
jgi:hypothetical protein